MLKPRAGHNPPRRIEWPPLLVTRDNLNDARIEGVLDPNLQRYPKE